jgi:hypothetical protein
MKCYDNEHAPMETHVIAMHSEKIRACRGTPEVQDCQKEYLRC